MFTYTNKYTKKNFQPTDKAAQLQKDLRSRLMQSLVFSSCLIPATNTNNLP